MATIGFVRVAKDGVVLSLQLGGGAVVVSVRLFECAGSEAKPEKPALRRSVSSM